MMPPTISNVAGFLTLTAGQSSLLLLQGTFQADDSFTVSIDLGRGDSWSTTVLDVDESGEAVVVLATLDSLPVTSKSPKTTGNLNVTITITGVNSGTSPPRRSPIQLPFITGLINLSIQPIGPPPIGP